MNEVGALANTILSGFSWTAKGDGSPGPWLNKVLSEALEAERKAAIEECARVAESLSRDNKGRDGWKAMATAAALVAASIRALDDSPNGDVT